MNAMGYIKEINSELDEIEDMILSFNTVKNVESYDDKKLSEIEAILVDIKSDLLKNGNG
jgi:hypothetical protein